MSVTAGITAVKASLDLAKLLSDRLNRPDIDVADVRTKVHEMLIHMVNAQVALGEANVEISKLRCELDDCKALKDIESSLEFAEHTYWCRTSGNKLDGPYCPTCWDDKRKLIRLKHADGRFGVNGDQRRYDCVLHGTVYLIPEKIFGPGRTIC